jgi:CBS-domain-containing membrane protein
MRPAATVATDATLHDVACAMLEHDVDAVAVVDGHGNVRGVVSAADLTDNERTLLLVGVPKPRLHGLWFAPDDLLESAAAACITTHAAAFMRTWFTRAEPTEPVSAVVQRLIKDGTQHAFVFESGGLVGVISTRELVQVVARAESNAQR